MPHQRDPESGPYDAATDPYIDPNRVLKITLALKILTPRNSKPLLYHRHDMTQGAIESFYGDSGRLVILIQENLTSSMNSAL